MEIPIQEWCARLRESTVKWEVSLTNESFAFKVLKLIEIKSISNKAKFVELKICEKVSNFMKENFIEDLKYFEKKNKIKIKIISENSLIIPEYIIDLQNKSKKTLEKIENFSQLRKITSLKNNEIEVKKISRKPSFKKKKFFRKKFHRKKN